MERYRGGGIETSADKCEHVCGEETGCITTELNCQHVHDDSCGYAPAVAGTPCSFVCAICSGLDGDGGDGGDGVNGGDGGDDVDGVNGGDGGDDVDGVNGGDGGDDVDGVNGGDDVDGGDGVNGGDGGDDVDGVENGEPATCTCTTKCTEGNVNTACPVCAAENADLNAVCNGAPAEPVECTCTTKCTADNVNKDCPVCSAAGDTLSDVCTGTASGPAVRSKDMTYDPNAMTLTIGTGDAAVTLNNVTCDNTELTIGKGNSGEVLNMNYDGDLDLTGTITDEDSNTYTIVMINNRAFQECSLKSINIPNSVTTIGEYAFGGCSALSSITIPNSVTTIEDSAFYRCSALSSITIPNSVTTIGNGAFSECSALSSITIPNSVTAIEAGTFSQCSALSSITIPNSVTSIGSGAFVYCTELKTVYISDKLGVSYSDVFYAVSEAFNAWLYNVMYSTADGKTHVSIVDRKNVYGESIAESATITHYAMGDGYVIDEAVPDNVTLIHDDLTKTEATAPTCTTAGNIAYWTCAVSGYLFSDEKGQNKIDKDDTVLPARHSLTKVEATAPTCTSSGHGTYWYCNECGKYFSDATGATEIDEPVVLPATGHSLTKVNATSPTCTSSGHGTYWYCNKCGKYFSDAYANDEIAAPDTIPATGHDYGAPEWSWAADGQSCSVTFTCRNDSSHIARPEVAVTSAVLTPATCTAMGTTQYTATTSFNGRTYTDTLAVADIPAIGHSYGEPAWTWAADGQSCSVTFTCQNDATHIETPAVTLTSAVLTPPTCTEPGTTEYTATTEFGGQTYTTTLAVADIPATGHSYDTGRCTVCGAIDPEFEAYIIDGAYGTWREGSSRSLSFTSNAAYADFLKVQVDERDIDPNCYTVSAGSTIVTLNAAYLNTLDVGRHRLAIVSQTGTATTVFTILEADAEPEEDIPLAATGDAGSMLLIALLLLSGCAVIGLSTMYVRSFRR